MQQSILALLTAGVIAINAVAVPAQAEPRDDRHDSYRNQRYDGRHDQRRDHDRYDNRPYVRSQVLQRGHGYSVPPNRIRHYRNIVILRPYGHLYPGYGRYYRDDDAYKWLAFTAIAVKLLDNLNEQQQREHEAAQVRATTAPIGETITWRDGSASGRVTAIREGTSSAGRYCREFQHEITIGGRKEQSYGTACRQPDGSWEIISTGQ